MLRSLRLSILLLGAIGVLACLIVALQGHWAQSRLNDSAGEAFVAKDVVADILPPPMYLIELRLVLSQAVEGTLTEPEASKQVDRLVSDYNDRVDYWTKHPPNGLEQQLLGAQHEAAKKFIAAARADVMARLKAGDKEGARTALLGVHQLFLKHLAGVEQTVAAGNKFAESSMASFAATQTESTRYALLCGGLAIVLVALFYRLVLRSVQSPVSRCIAFAERVAAGNLSERLDTTRTDDIGRLQRALAEMQESLRGLVANVRNSTDSIAIASTEIATGNQDLSDRTEQTASNLQQAASSMEQLTGNVRQSADSARQANQLATSAAEVAARGGAVVAQVVATMEDINASSNKISDIIGVIDGIAFQTNILALNAAVEAARAGEQGRGFAVVAGEVRSLAQRSAEAAKEIKGLIGASVEKVEGGSRLVADAGKTMNEIVSSVQRVSDIIGEITAASTEQSDGIGQINVAVGQLDQMTQQNSALVEQSAAAAQSLKEQAARLSGLVGTFQLDGSGQARPAVARQADPQPQARLAVRPAAPPAPRKAAASARAAAPPAKRAPAAVSDSSDWESF
jgi:methyl-accepting chemotaxis protein